MRLHTSLILGLLAAAALSIPSPASAQVPRNGHAPLSDAQIKADVEHTLSDIALGPAQVNVSVQGAVVTLSGTVPSLWLKEEAVTRARKADDVTSVVADLAVMKGDGDQSVTLKGAALSEVERRVAENAARGTFGVRSVRTCSSSSENGRRATNQSRCSPSTRRATPEASR